MTDDPAAAPAWPDPSKPGVPLNPERDGFHWVLDANHEPAAAMWTAEIQRWGVWPYTRPSEMAEDNSYLGPCLTPSEAAAERAAAERRGREEAVNVAMLWHPQEDLDRAKKRIAALPPSDPAGETALAEVVRRAVAAEREACAAMGARDD